MKCRHPLCGISFQLVKDFLHHLQDIHGIKFTEAARKRQLDLDSEGDISRAKKRRQASPPSQKRNGLSSLQREILERLGTSSLSGSLTYTSPFIVHTTKQYALNKRKAIGQNIGSTPVAHTFSDMDQSTSSLTATSIPAEPRDSFNSVQSIDGFRTSNLEVGKSAAMLGVGMSLDCIDPRLFEEPGTL
jgi:uncharacterized C2H2 Zn-finger protein